MRIQTARNVSVALLLAGVGFMGLVLGYTDQQWVKLAVVVIVILMMASDLVGFYYIPRPNSEEYKREEAKEKADPLQRGILQFHDEWKFRRTPPQKDNT